MKKMIPLASAILVLAIIFGTIYGVVQQEERLQANDPQIQIAEDTATALNAGQSPQTLSESKVNINSSLAPFFVIYDKSGHIVSGTGYLNRVLPQAPVGILTNANNVDYHWVTWQPQNDVRIAAVTVAANNYYVLSGRNLREVEKNENISFQISALGGILSVIVVLVTYFVIQPQPKKKRSLHLSEKA